MNCHKVKHNAMSCVEADDQGIRTLPVDSYSVRVCLCVLFLYLQRNGVYVIVQACKNDVVYISGLPPAVPGATLV